MACALGDAIESDYSTRLQRPRLGVRVPETPVGVECPYINLNSTGIPAPASSLTIWHRTCDMTASLTLILTLFNHATPDCDSVAHDWK